MPVRASGKRRRRMIRASTGTRRLTNGGVEMSRTVKTKELAVRGARVARHGMSVGGRSLVDETIATVAKIPVRDRDELWKQFPDHSPDEIAAELIRRAARASAAVGATVGAWAFLPIVPVFPVEAVAETLAVVGIEVKLVAELHELYGIGVTGSTVARMSSYLGAWVDRRSAVLVPGGLALAVGSPLRKRLSRRLAQRTGRSALSLGPLLSGVAAGAWFNRRETRRMGEAVHAAVASEPLALRQWG
jgi:hypothetical protein